MVETKKKAKLSIEEKIARREEMAQKNSNELKVLKRKLSEHKRKELDYSQANRHKNAKKFVNR